MMQPSWTRGNGGNKSPLAARMPSVVITRRPIVAAANRDRDALTHCCGHQWQLELAAGTDSLSLSSVAAVRSSAQARVTVRLSVRSVVRCARNQFSDMCFGYGFYWIIRLRSKQQLQIFKIMLIRNPSKGDFQRSFKVITQLLQRILFLTLTKFKLCIEDSLSYAETRRLYLASEFRRFSVIVSLSSAFRRSPKLVFPRASNIRPKANGYPSIILNSFL